MADNTTTGAVHLTSLDLDISGVKNSLAETEKLVQETAKKIREIKITPGSDGTSSGASGNTVTNASASINAIESLNLSYKNFLNTLSKSKLTDSALKNIPQEAQQASQQMESLTKSVQSNNKVTDEQAAEYQRLSSTLKDLIGSLKDAETNAIKTGTGFKQVGDSAKGSTSSVQSFLLRLADKAKWMVAYQLIMLVRNAFNSVVNTIKETEDSVVELQKVLGDKSLASTEISDQLYDIAYRYGQTFEVVQEAAVLFAQTGQSWSEVINSVEATMLALNAAELEVSTATQGLIAIMTQFKIEAEDLETVIDKINVTSDKFPVTSEKIVAALQRAGSTAYNYGLSLEETIGIVAALGETTGRTGEAIGTALNSLITFSMKESSLKKFSEYLGGLDLSDKNVLEIWALLGAKIDETGDSMAKMMASSEEFSDLFNEELATAIGLTDEYNAAVMNAQDVYSAVGTYRQNYFIALLNDISSAVEAMEYMGDVAGYTQKKNEQYLDTLTAKWNQLVIAAKELAVQFGDAGFMDFMKLIVEATTGVLKLTKELGGLNTVLGLFAIALIKVKAQKINEWADRLRVRFTLLKYEIRDAGSVLDFLKKGFSNAIAGMKSFISTAAGMATAITAAIVVLNIINQKIQEYKQAQEEARQENISLALEHAEESLNIAKLASQYKKLKEASDNNAESKEDLTEVSTELLKALGYEEEEIDKLIGKYGELSDEIESVVDETLEQRIVEASQAVRDAEESIENFIAEQQRGEAALYASISADDIIDAYDAQISRMEEIRKEYKELDKLSDVVNDSEYQSLKKITDGLSEYVEKVKSTRENLVKLQIASGNLEGALSPIYDAMSDMSDMLNILIPSTDDFGNSAKNAATSIEDMETEIERLSDLYDEISGKVDAFQSAYSDIVDIIDEYNETGNMTADMLQTLLSLEPEYISILDTKNGILSINQDNLNNLITLNDDYLIRLASVRVAEEAETMAKQLKEIATENLTEAEIEARLKTIALQSSVEQATYAYLTGNSTAEDFRNTIADIAATELESVGAQDTLTNSIMATTNAYGDLITMAGLAKQTIQSVGDATIPNSFLNLTPESLRNQVASLRSTRTSLTPQEQYVTALISNGKNSGIETYDQKTASKSSTQKTAAELLQEELKEMDEEYQAVIDDIDHLILLAEKSGAEPDKIIELIIKKMELAHEQAEKYRAMGLEENDDYIQSLQKSYLGWVDDVDDAWSNFLKQMDSDFDEEIADIEHRIFLAQRNGASPEEIVKLKKEEQELIHQQAEKYRALDLEETKSYIRDLQKAYVQLEDDIEDIYADVLSSMSSALSESLADTEHEILLMERNKAPQEEIVSKYKGMQDALHALAEEYRAMGLSEDSDFIQELQKKWLDYEDAILAIYDGIYDKILATHEATLKVLTFQYDVLSSQESTESMKENLEKQRDVQIKIMNEAHKEAERLRSLGVEENDAAIQACIDDWINAYNATQDINSKLEDIILSTYDDFIALADSFDIWDKLDFTKVDYLKAELKEVDSLYEDGIITLTEYKSLLESLGLSLFNAQQESLEKQGDKIQEYYDGIISRYEEEIEEIKKLQSESDDYYDSLIANLQDVQDSNDRINAQLDYYASRQKILTNLEQAQSRSGIEWREKEMQYQQQLIDLDENWRRTQEDWSLADQIEELEKLKQAASDEFEASIERINGYIETAQKMSEAALAGISAQVDILREKIFRSLTDVLNEDITNVGNSILTALEDSQIDIQTEIGKIGTSIETELGGSFNGIDTDAQESSKTAQTTFEQQFINPTLTSINSIGEALRVQLVEDAKISASSMADVFRKNFIKPIKIEIDSIMSEAMSQLQSANSQLQASSANKFNAPRMDTINTANIYASIGSASSANATISSLSSILSNPRRI